MLLYLRSFFALAIAFLLPLTVRSAGAPLRVGEDEE